MSGSKKTVYTMNDLREVIAPIAARYGSPRVYVFGSYARGAATPESDIDLFVDPNGMDPMDSYALAWDASEALGKDIDIHTTTSVRKGSPFWKAVHDEMVAL